MKKYNLTEELKNAGFVETENGMKRVFENEYGSFTVYVMNDETCRVSFYKGMRFVKSKEYKTAGKRTFNAIVSTVEYAGYDFTATVSEPETKTNATVKAAIARLTRRVKRETGDNIRDCFEAIAEEHDAAPEAIAAMEKEAEDSAAGRPVPQAADIAETVKKFAFLVRKHDEMMNNAHIASLKRDSAIEMDYLGAADRLYKAVRNAEARLRNAGADVKVTDGDYPYYHITGVTVNGCAVYPEAAPEETPDAQEPEAVTETAPAPEFDYDFLDCRYVLFEHVCGSFSNEYETDKLKEARDRLKEEWDGSLESGDWGLFDRDARQYIRIRATAKGRKAFMAENARLAMKAAPRSEFVLERLYSQAKRDGELERLHYAEIGGGYSDTPHVEIWTEKVVSNFFVTTIYNHTLGYSTLKYADTPEQAERDFTEARGKYLQPLQKAKVENARLAAKAAPQEPDATPEPVSDAE